ncbi:putative quinol monooxygenase [Flavobacterium sp. Root901]|uniref:putative quinol monooxygenase n=1 Tax=Flavobacterium sp. Root901 TaxID=1736605 RepID=UPI001F568B66|nr:antibiotic biosynthesis monooxygenase family protein [Flavobacterium sp. Root901]
MYFILAVLFAPSNVFAQKKDMMVRIAEIEIYPQYVTEYNSILKEESSASVKLEPGVLAIFPMYEKKDSVQVKIVEIYADNEAYQNHLKTPHFQKYKYTTLKMVKSLKLIDMTAIDPESMKLLFSKIRQ